MSGTHRDDKFQVAEAHTRANIGLSRSIGVTTICSPLDMRGPIGAATIMAVRQAGISLLKSKQIGVIDSARPVPSCHNDSSGLHQAHGPDAAVAAEAALGIG